MGIISKIKDIIFKIKDYDRLENDYSSVLDYATGGLLSSSMSTNVLLKVHLRSLRLIRNGLGIISQQNPSVEVEVQQ